MYRFRVRNIEFLSRLFYTALALQRTLYSKKILRKYMSERELIPPGKLIEIGFEELERAPLETLEKTYKGLGIEGLEKARPANREHLDSVKDYKKNKYRPLPDRLIHKINKPWDFWFKKFGYVELE